MTKRELLELIRTVIKEYTGTGDMASMGRTSDDGNNVTSPRPFIDDEAERENYMSKNSGEGGQGNQTRGMEKGQKIGNPNRTRMTPYV